MIEDTLLLFTTSDSRGFLLFSIIFSFCSTETNEYIFSRLNIYLNRFADSIPFFLTNLKSVLI